MRGLVAVFVAFALAGPVSAVPATAPQGTEAFVRALAELINAYRLEHGLAPLSLAGDLDHLATEHSNAMAAQRQLSHAGFQDRFRTARSRVCVENVGMNYRTPEGLFNGWRQSPSHHRNLLEPVVSRMGLAANTRFVTFFACV